MTSFGGDVIDNRGVVRDFPARSMLAGLIGNALGYDRADADALDALQSRIIDASALVRPGRRSRDYQTARLFEKDVGWTTRGRPEGRASSPSFTWDDRYESERGVRMKALTHQRYRDYDADALTLVAIGLREGPSGPDMDDVERALGQPERPLFIGRKPHLPSGPIGRGRVHSPSVAAALCASLNDGSSKRARFQSDLRALPDGLRFEPSGFAERDSLTGTDLPLESSRLVELCDERRHVAGVHAGTRTVVQGWIVPVGAGKVDGARTTAGMGGSSS